MEEDEHGFINGGSHAPPPSISLSNFSPSITPISRRRLSSQFNEPTRPINSARRLSWVSLQGRLVGAEEASSAKSIRGDLNSEEAIAWNLFTPIHRILVVAIIAAVTNDLKKMKQISSLKRSVELRDQVLSSMQQKLDNLCEQVNKDRQDNVDEFSFGDNAELQLSNLSPGKTSLSSCGCCTCKQHEVLPNAMDSFDNTSGGDEMSKFKSAHMYNTEQEERRMSDLSDWASSVTSAADIQLNALGMEQDIYHLQRECEEKDATIKELSTAVRSVNAAGSKRIAELEDVVRRKNMIISKLKKDMLVLEEKVVQLIRLRRPSYSSTARNIQQLPVMKDNLVYDMDSTTSPSSSSDSDSDLKNQPHTLEPPEDHKISSHEDNFASPSNISNVNESASRSQVSSNGKDSSSRGQMSSNGNNYASKSQMSVKASALLPGTADRTPKQQPRSPLQETTMNRKLDSTVPLRPKHAVSTLADTRRIRRRSQLGLNGRMESRRWS